MVRYVSFLSVMGVFPSLIAPPVSPRGVGALLRPSDQLSTQDSAVPDRTLQRRRENRPGPVGRSPVDPCKGKCECPLSDPFPEGGQQSMAVARRLPLG